MLQLKKPARLNQGDTIALVSSSSGLAGEPTMKHRTDVGIKRLREMGYKVKVMPNALKGIAFNYNNPKVRAEELMAAFRDPEVKAIISTLGGDDSVRLLPYLDFDVIRLNPKIFMGYSDSTFTHFVCMKAGISSFYGMSLLTDFAENNAFPDYSLTHFNKTLTQNKVIGDISTSEFVFKHGLRWDKENEHIDREKIDNTGYDVVNGKGQSSGPLIGGCLELMISLRGTEVYPADKDFEGAILFLETSEVIAPAWLIEDFMRSLGALGTLDSINGIIFGRPQNGHLYQVYKEIVQKIMKEWGHEDKPVLFNGSFGHNEPKCILPYGRNAVIDADLATFKITESAVE
ncbi:S66 peptidase family protein [Macrococcus equi]|uniref:S66 family peptidase n=1 Tax=Macrococcus equi TaxID=3395462 RepID=UPI0039BE92F9